MVTLVDQDRVKGFMNEHSPIRLVKSSIVQMARSTQSLLVTMPSLVRILKEHRESNLVEMERLRKMLEDKEVELVERVKEADHLSQKESKL